MQQKVVELRPGHTSVFGALAADLWQIWRLLATGCIPAAAAAAAVRSLFHEAAAVHSQRNDTKNKSV